MQTSGSRNNFTGSYISIGRQKEPNQMVSISHYWVFRSNVRELTYSGRKTQHDSFGCNDREKIFVYNKEKVSGEVDLTSLEADKPLKEMSEKLPPEMPNSENLKDMHSQVEAFLRTSRDAVSESRSSLPEDLVFDQRNESSNRQYHRTEDHLDAAGVSDLSQNGEDTPHDGNRSTNIREALHPQSKQSASRSPKSGEGQREVIEQFEPGVYVTLVQLQNGTKIFKRVRFSKRRFAEQQAEEWWMENKDRLIKKYNPPAGNSTPTGPSTTPPSEENNEPTPSS